jgi:hypothetical protein
MDFHQDIMIKLDLTKEECELILRSINCRISTLCLRSNKSQFLQERLGLEINNLDKLMSKFLQIVDPNA